MSDDHPRGRDAVKLALLDAAAELFAARGAASVSVRDVAAHAGVNHGLVHRHFGSKDALRRAVMNHLTSRIALAAAGPTGGGKERPDGDALRLGELPRAFSATAALGSYWRMLARAMLDGEDIRAVQEKFPVIEGILEQLREAQRAGKIPADADVRIIAAASVALGLGWLLFEPFVLAATGLTGVSGVRETVFDALLAMIAGPSASPPVGPAAAADLR